jgi:g-D-glutamyl-meso-diaminopimelate peptidase
VKFFFELEQFYARYSGEKTIIGKSVLSRPIYAMKVGNGFPLGIVQGGIHAREWLTAPLVLEQLKIGVRRGSVWFIPLTNPDGAFLCTDGLSSVADETRRKRLLALNGNRRDFSSWKANASAVDLNVNFDARWGNGVQNIHSPAPANYIGKAPFSEPETAALRDFTLAVRPDYTLSYHAWGREIYWQFYQPFLRCLRDRQYAMLLSSLVGYPLKRAEGSAGGYKDWCVEKLKIPAFTVEVGERSPIKYSLPAILKENLYTVREFNGRFAESKYAMATSALPPTYDIRSPR